MNKKIIIGASVLVVFILVISLFSVYKQTRFKKELTTQLDSLKKEYDFIDSYETSGYYSALLSIKVNQKFNNLSNSDKYQKIAEIDYRASNIISSALNHNNIGYDAKSLIENQSLKCIQDKDIYIFKFGKLTLPDGTEITENGIEPKIENASNTESTQSTNTSVISQSSSPSGLYPCEPSEENKVFAWAAAKQTVEENLKAPSTADFPFGYFNQKIKEVDYNVFEVNSYVDAENSFGAKIRTNFTVRIKKTGKDSYVVENVSID